MPQQQGVRLRSAWWLLPASLGGLMFVLLCGDRMARAETASSPPFPVPDVLRPNVAFWKKIFTVLDTRSGVLHDPDNVTIVYHTLRDLPESSQERQEVIDTFRARYKRILETLAQGKRQLLDSDEARVLALFKGKQTPDVLRVAAENMRFQSGIRDRFVEGLLRSVAYLPEMERIFAAADLPRELTLLPHVESSFHPKAYSKAGAAGMWQFTAATGRQFMRIDRRVDERFNVRLSTIAAAKLLRQNYEELGTWPLAITAYNHGVNGMKQAVNTVGTRDFGTIVEQYRGPLFGFSSKNFYAEFLAAVDIVKHYRQYFPDLTLDRSPRLLMADSSAAQDVRPAQTVASVPRAQPRQEYRVRPGDTLWSIAQRFGTTASTLAVFNGLQQRNRVKAGQVLALPPASSPAAVADHTPPPEAVKPVVRTAAVAPAPPPAGRRPPTKTYRVRPGDTLSTIAQRFGTTVPSLAALNRLKQHHVIKPGQVLRIPAGPQQEITASVTHRRTLPSALS